MAVEGLMGWSILLTVLALAFVVFRRLADHWTARAAVAGLAVALITEPVVVLYESHLRLGSDSVEVVEAPTLTLKETPDIFLVVLDGYPGLLALEQDAGLSKKGLVEELGRHGFEIPASIWSSYWSTQLSIPAVLQMDYPLREASGGQATVDHLYEIIGGENALLRVLKANGYESHMVESGWSGSACGPAFDRCAPSALFDEAVSLALQSTVVRPFLIGETVLSTFTVGAQRRIDWLLSAGVDLSYSAEPTFVFAHIVAPHPPFFLNAECESLSDPGRGEATFYTSGTPAAERDSQFLEQMKCVDSFMVEFAGRVDPEDVVVFVADHGTDRRFQLATPPEQWNQEAIVERFNVFAAARTREGCRIKDAGVTPNLMRRVLSCSSDSTVSDHPPRMWIRPMVELEPEYVGSLLEMDLD